MSGDARDTSGSRGSGEPGDSDVSGAPEAIDLPRLAPERPAAGVERRRVTGERLELIAYRYEPGAEFPRHEHEAEQLTIVRSGALVFVFDDGEVRLEPGQALLVEGGRPHGAYVPREAGVTETYNVFTPVRERPPDGPERSALEALRTAPPMDDLPLDRSRDVDPKE